MRYTPYTEAQIQSMNILDEGIYRFKVGDVILNDKFGGPLQDKNGNDLAKLKLLAADSEGRDRIIYTFISGDGNFAYKLRHFAQTIGMISDYENGTFNIMRAIGKTGIANVIVKKGTTKSDGSGEPWPDKNDIKDFVVDSGMAIAQKAKLTFEKNHENNIHTENKLEQLDDDVPF